MKGCQKLTLVLYRENPCTEILGFNIKMVVALSSDHLDVSGPAASSALICF